MYRLRQMDVDDKVCDQVDMTLLAQVYPAEVIQRCVGGSEPWASKVRRVRQSTMLALVLFVIGMAASEPSFPTSGVGQTGWQAQRSASRRVPEPVERFGLERAPKGPGQPGLAGVAARVLSGAGAAADDAKSRSLVAIGSWPSMARSSTPPILQPMRPPDAAQQQSIWQRGLSPGALCAAGRVWQSCRRRARDQPLRCLRSACGAPLARRARAGHASVGGRRDHLGWVSGARPAARGARAGGIGSRRMGTPAWPTASV